MSPAYASFPSFLDKSTNGRLTLFRQAGSALAARAVTPFAPGLAARLLESAFLTTGRRRVPARERRWEISAERFSIPGRRCPLAAYRWTAVGGSRGTVLFVHGWQGRGSQLGAFATALATEGFDGVAFDAPGHGRSPGNRSSLVEMIEAVQDVATELGTVDVAIAHSAGTAATTVALSQGLALRGVVLVAPPTNLGHFLYGTAEQLRIPWHVARRTQTRIEHRFGVRWDTLRSDLLATSMDLPALVVHDVGDRSVPYDHGRRIAHRWPGARLRSTNDLGHHRVLRDRRIIQEAVAFVSEVVGAAGTMSSDG